MTQAHSRTTGSAAIAAVLGAVLINELTIERASTPSSVAMAYAVALTLTTIAGWYAWQGKRWQSASREPAAVVRVVAMTISAVLAIRIMEWEWLFRFASISVTNESAGLTTLSAWLLVCLVRPLAEEALLRGYLLSRMRMVSSERATIVTVALLSALITASLDRSVVHVVSNTALAATLSLVVLRTHRLWVAAAMHVLLALIGEAVRRPILAAGSPNPIATIVLVLVAIGSIIALLRVLRGTRWVEPANSHRGVAPPVTWHLDLPP